ncbi:MAG: asparaginase [Gammaproteobacteria bacterium]|nr:asparaginase [Gammaproteobacteria bacterium]
MPAKLIIHGGAGSREGEPIDSPAYAEAVRTIVRASFSTLLRFGARAAAVEAVARLEDDDTFNAGTGSRLQRDGVARMSAALMDSDSLALAAVINIEDVRHPIEVADRLHGQYHPVLAGEHATRFARQAGFNYHDVVTPHRKRELAQHLRGPTGTVGDSPTVAGTYVSKNAGISCTGAGEEIVNQATAVRVVTRIDDGWTLARASAITVAQGESAGYRYGFIALDRYGQHTVAQTSGITTVYAVTDGEQLETFDG